MRKVRNNLIVGKLNVFKCISYFRKNSTVRDFTAKLHLQGTMFNC